MSDEKDQGWFESNESYRRRKNEEADEATIERTSGTSPSRRWFESDDAYSARIRLEADERLIEDATGSRLGKSLFESNEDYDKRASRTAGEQTIEDLTGRRPSRDLFEGEDTYRERVAREADEAVVTAATGSEPSRGLFESEEDYRKRLALEAAEHKAQDRQAGAASLASRAARRTAPADAGDDGGLLWAIMKLSVVAGLALMALAIGLAVLMVAAIVALLALVVQFAFAEAVRRRLGAAVRFYLERGRSTVWIGPIAGTLLVLPLAALTLQSGEVFAILVTLAGIVAGGYLGYRVSEWVSRKRLGSLSIDALFAAGLKELQPALLYSVGGLLAVLYLGGSVWLFTSSGETRMPSSRHGGGTSAVVDPSGARTDQRFVDAPGDGFLSIRSEPTVRTGERLGRVPHGDPVRVLDAQPVRDTIEGIAGNWVRVRYQGISGWVFDGYLRDSSPLAAGRGAGGAYTPQRGTAERQAILDAARAQVASDLGYDAPFLFVVDHLKVYQGWALFRGKPTDQDGRMLSRGCEDADEVTMVLLRERNAAWNVEAGGTVCTTDVFWAGWTDYLGAPAEIF